MRLDLLNPYEALWLGCTERYPPFSKSTRKDGPLYRIAGAGEVVIGGFRYQVTKSMPEDFRSYDLSRIVANLAKPVLALHSRTDETVGYHHAIKNCGFADGPKTRRPKIVADAARL